MSKESHFPMAALVPPPRVIRSHLAQAAREARLLRRLLRLSIDAVSITAADAATRSDMATGHRNLSRPEEIFANGGAA
jgi:hypothetical protein